MFTFKIDDELSLDLPESHDAPEVFAAIDANREHLGRWLPWVPTITSVEDERNSLMNLRKRYAEGTGFTCILREHGVVVGGLGTPAWDGLNQMAEVGYWLIESACGRGIMTRSVRRVCDELFSNWNINRIEIRAEPANTPSRAIPERLGFALEGTLHQRVVRYNGYADLMLYSMLKRDWKIST